ncbi:MAG: guanylate kinase [Pirellulaceae bacterium]
MPKGKVVIISGPSGAGKTTLVRRVLEASTLPLELSVSVTTRPARPGEVDGKDYHFWTDDAFQAGRTNGSFLECFEVFGRGYWYGTLRSEVADRMNAGRWVVLEIDVQGMQEVVKAHPDAITFFVRPDSLETLRQRLEDRGTETPESLRRRLEVAAHEWNFRDKYRYEIINNNLDDAVAQMIRILSESVE